MKRVKSRYRAILQFDNGNPEEYQSFSANNPRNALQLLGKLLQRCGIEELGCEVDDRVVNTLSYGEHNSNCESSIRRIEVHSSKGTSTVVVESMLVSPKPPEDERVGIFSWMTWIFLFSWIGYNILNWIF